MVLCKPKLLPLKSVTLEKLEKMQKDAQDKVMEQEAAGTDEHVEDKRLDMTHLRVASCSGSALGMASGEIPNLALTASSWLNYNNDFYGPSTARFNLEPYGPWVPDVTDTTTPWIQVFTSSTAATTTHNFPQSVEARFVRIEPTACNEYCALRFEVMGCPARPKCDYGWDAFDEYGSCFKFDHSARVIYVQADAACQSQGAKLATIHEEKQQFFISGDPECFTMTNGGDYRGRKSTTKLGKTCQKWTSQSPQSHSVTPDKYPNMGLGDHNYCRNPDGESSAWCYTTDVNTRWDYCNVGAPSESCPASKLQKDGSNTDDGYYIGLNDMTTENVFQWKDGTPLDYVYWESGEPNGGDQDCVALWPHGDGKWRDYRCLGLYAYICKTPKVSVCYTGFEEFQGNCYFFDHNARVTFVQAQTQCQSKGAKLASIHSVAEQVFLAGDIECYTESNGADYRGHISVTESGKICQKWTSQTPQEHSRTPSRYPNSGLGDHNYCRNPDSEPRPWCYTTDINERWDYCNVGQPKASCIVRIQQDPQNVDDGYFVGLRDETNEGVYQWSDNSQYDYTNWAPGQPDNYGSDQDCVAVWPHQDGKWKDNQCTRQYPYICQKRREISFLGRTVTQSSTITSAYRATDGNTNSFFSGNSCSQTYNQYGAWWMIDQVYNQCIGSIAIYNRQDCCKEKLVGAVIRVGDNSNRNNNPVCGSPITLNQVNAGSVIEVECNLRGRYISISLSGTQQLTLCEVKAYLGKCDSNIDVQAPFNYAVCASPAPLGMANGQLTDSMISTSTILYADNYFSHYARLDGPRSWTADLSDNYPWIQVDLFGTTNNAVSGVMTQGAPSYDEWITQYRVQLGDQQCSLQYILGTDNKPKVFNANADRSTKVTNMFAATVRARYVRLCIVQWYKYTSMRLEILGCRLAIE
ncbi:uncharacterized protein [Amphiura filiformis]|uniref:uncharacterized protein n=1 Tax=Amphiura filiformis TaxID=82378 RepID=UPI003B20EB16